MPVHQPRHVGTYAPPPAEPLSLASLREAVRTEVRALRDAGLPPEQVVIRIKALANARKRPCFLTGDTLELDLLRVQELRTAMVRWAIADYFDEESVLAMQPASPELSAGR